MGTGMDEEFGRERILLGEAHTPGAAMDEDVNRRVWTLRRVDVEPFDGGGTVGMALRGA